MNNEKLQHFSIRKLSVGAVSVLIGLSFMGLSHSQQVKADTVNEPTQVQTQCTTQTNTTASQQGVSKTTQNGGVKAPSSTTVQTPETVASSQKTNSSSVQNAQNVNKSEQNYIQTQNLQPKQTHLATTNSSDNGGFDQNTWGTLDVSKWQGQENNGIYQLTNYTGDITHIIVPNEADFAKVGQNVGQVGITSNLTRSWTNGTNNIKDQTIAFSKTDNKKVKAIGNDWHNGFGSINMEEYDDQLLYFDGTNFDVSNVTNMAGIVSR